MKQTLIIALFFVAFAPTAHAAPAFSLTDIAESILTDALDAVADAAEAVATAAAAVFQDPVDGPPVTDPLGGLNFADDDDCTDPASCGIGQEWPPEIDPNG